MIGALECKSCGRMYSPPRFHCNKCGESKFAEVHLDGAGEVYSYTVIRVAFEDFREEAPYTFAEVKLAGGLVVPARFTNEKEKEIKIGSKVNFVRRDRRGNWFDVM